MKRILLFLVYGFAGAGVFTFLVKGEETNKEKAKRMLQQLKNNFSMHQDITDEEFERFATALYKAIRVNKTLDWSYFRAVDFTYSALTTIGEFSFYMFTGETRPSRHWSLLLMNHNSCSFRYGRAKMGRFRMLLDGDSPSFFRKELCVLCL